MELVRLSPFRLPASYEPSIMHSSELFWALLVFVVVTLFTPGPNNTMLLASGLNFGFRRGLPHLLGVALGFALMVLAVGVGLGAVFQAYPAAYTVLKYAGAAYLLYLAWQIATAGAVDEGGKGRGRPITFLEASSLPVAQPEGLGDGGRRRHRPTRRWPHSLSTCC